MNTETGWLAWNRLYQTWMQATRRHATLKATMQELELLDSVRSEQAKDTAAFMQGLAGLLERRMCATMVKTLLENAGHRP